MATRKYWIGSSGENDTKPTNFDTYIVFNEDELFDAQHDIALWIANDFLGDLENEIDESA